MILKNVLNNFLGFRIICNLEYWKNIHMTEKAPNDINEYDSLINLLKIYFKNRNFWQWYKQFPKRDIERSSVVGSDVMA